MKKTRSAGIVVFHRGEQLRFLLLEAQVKTTYWTFPRGQLEEGETHKEAAIRETKEEANLDVETIDGFEEQIKYKYMWDGELIDKDIIFFLGESQTDAVTISHEHTNFEWLSFEQAQKRLSFSNQKKVLKKAHTFLKKHVL